MMSVPEADAPHGLKNIIYNYVDSWSDLQSYATIYCRAHENNKFIELRAKLIVNV